MTVTGDDQHGDVRVDLKPLAAKYWREARAIGAAAHAAGVAWSLPAARHILSLEMSHDGTRALSAGDDGVARIHDLVRRTTRTVIDLGVPVRARLADGDHRVVVWHDNQLVLIDPATGARRDLTTEAPILGLEVVGATAFWIDARHALWQLDLAGAAPVQIPFEEPVVSLTPSPDGRWIALGGEQHLFLYDRTQPAAAAREVALGRTEELSWSADGKFVAAMMWHAPRDNEGGEVGGEVLAIQPEVEPPTVMRRIVPQHLSVAYHGGKLYTAGPTGVVNRRRIGRAHPQANRRRPGRHRRGARRHDDRRGERRAHGAVGGHAPEPPFVDDRTAGQSRGHGALAGRDDQCGRRPDPRRSWLAMIFRDRVRASAKGLQPLHVAH